MGSSPGRAQEVVCSTDNVQPSGRVRFAQVGGMEAWVSSTLAWMNVTKDSINITVALFRRVRFLFWALVALAMIKPTRRLFTP